MRYILLISCLFSLISCKVQSDRKAIEEELRILEEKKRQQEQQVSEASSQEKTDASFRLVEKGNYASCFVYAVLDEQGDTLGLPNKFKDALDCPSIAMIYDDYLVTVVASDMMRYNLQTQKEVTLFGVYDDLDGMSGPIVAEDGRLLFSMINQERKYGYQAAVRLIMLEIENGELVNKRKFDRAVNFVCGSYCYAAPGGDFGFQGQDSLWFRHHEAMEGGGKIEYIPL